MPANHAKYAVRGSSGTTLTIEDVGSPWTDCKTITNDAEFVVKELIRMGWLSPVQRLFYYDSEGEKCEILHDASGNVRGFAACDDGKTP